MRQRTGTATGAAKESLEPLFTNRYEGGFRCLPQVVTSQIIALSNELNDIDILRRQLDASVRLIRAFDGDWNACVAPPESGSGC
jgi:outer membrane protein TolC